MHLGWFGMGSGALADATGVGEVAVAAEALGYESLWVGEHPVLVDPQVPPSPLPPDSPMLDPVPTLAFAAARTTRIRLGTGIVILPMRNPLLLAKEAASLDVLSGGRLLLGVGVGYVPGEYEALGLDFHTRGRRADEAIDTMRAVWHGAAPVRGVSSRPRPLQATGPAVVVSGMSTAARRRAVARGDGWYGFFLDRAGTAAAIDELHRLAGEVERAPGLGPLEITVTPPGPVDADDAKRYEDLGVDRLVLLRQFEDLAGPPDARRRRDVMGQLERSAALIER